MSSRFMVWSHEHGGWWRRGTGYTRHMSEARIFSRDAALEVCRQAIPGTADRLGALPELPIALDDVRDFASEFMTAHPGESWQ